MGARDHVLGTKDIRALKAIAANTPSLIGDRPARLVFHPGRVDVWATLSFGQSVPDRSTVISCGAVVSDLSVAVRADGRMTAVHVRPLRSEPRLIAAIHIGRERMPKHRENLFYEAMMGPRGYQTPMPAVEVDGFWSTTLADLEVAALDGSATLHTLTTPQRRKVSDVLSEAGRKVGIDLFDGFDPADESPTRTAVLSTRVDNPAMWVWAGVAWRRVLLTATRHGVSTSYVGTLLDGVHARWRIQDALLCTDWPQVILRFGLVSEHDVDLRTWGTALAG